jgi:hypothetical protein
MSPIECPERPVRGNAGLRGRQLEAEQENIVDSDCIYYFIIYISTEAHDDASSHSPGPSKKRVTSKSEERGKEAKQGKAAKKKAAATVAPLTVHLMGSQRALQASAGANMPHAECGCSCCILFCDAAT